jgi:alkylation response protein AidB-like acyl-CoA dehydrogenase
LRSSVHCSATSSTVTFDGISGFVLDADIADDIVVRGVDGEGRVFVAVVDPSDDGMSIQRTPMVDITRRAFRVELDGVSVPTHRLLAEPGEAGASIVERLIAIGVFAATCDATGTADRVVELSTAYAREREQFGRPIGTFQAVKHHCSNMSIAVQSSRSAVSSLATVLDSEPARWSTAASITASYVGPACSEACALALRVHGGIGFTWEHDCHLHLKRAMSDEMLFGTPTWHRHRLADALFPALVAESAP